MSLLNTEDIATGGIGGIASGGTLALASSTFTTNHATGDGGGARARRASPAGWHRLRCAPGTAAACAMDPHALPHVDDPRDLPHAMQGAHAGDEAARAGRLIGDGRHQQMQRRRTIGDTDPRTLRRSPNDATPPASPTSVRLSPLTPMGRCTNRPYESR